MGKQLSILSVDDALAPDRVTSDWVAMKRRFGIPKCKLV